MPHGIDFRQYIAHIYDFELGEEWHINLELEFTFNVVSVSNMPVLVKDNLHFCCLPRCAA